MKENFPSVGFYFIFQSLLCIRFRIILVGKRDDDDDVGFEPFVKR